MKPSLRLFPRSWPERLRLKRAVAHLQISLGPLGCAGFVEWPAKLFVEHHVRWNGQRLIHTQGIAQSHHLQTHGRDREIDLYRFGRHVTDALDDLETLIEQLIDGDNFVYQADAQRFLSVDMIADKSVAQRVFNPASSVHIKVVLEPWRTS